MSAAPRHHPPGVTQQALFDLELVMDLLMGAPMSAPQLDRFAWNMKRGQDLAMARLRSMSPLPKERGLQVVEDRGELHEIGCAGPVDCSCVKVWPV